MEEVIYYAIALTVAVILALFVYDALTVDPASKENGEHFFGGYYYPYDYPYYWPYFYTGCNEDMFGNIKCLPFSAFPFW